MTSTSEEFEPSARSSAGGSGRGTKKLAYPARVALYNRQIVSELRKVIWPTRNELVTYTVVSIAFVTGMVAFVGLLDYLFTKVIFAMFG
jgi:preprotein translocase subunit SecE